MRTGVPLQRATLAVALLLLVAGCGRREREAATPSGVPKSAPDLVLITLDTFRADRAGCYGHSGGLTPAIDRALRNGLLARSAYAPAPLTAVSHATILTGLQPCRHGVRENGSFKLADSVTTLATHLTSRGFRTAAFIAAFPLDKRFGFGQGFATFDQDLVPQDDDGTGTYYAERPAREVVDRALAWENALSPGDRVFLWAHFFDPHHPRHPLPQLRRLPVADGYEREIRGMDLQIGRLFRGIEAAGRDPLVVIVSDHGEGLGDHREPSHGVLLHESTMRGLFGAAAPRESRVAERLRGIRDPVMSYVDIAPTLLDALDVEPLPGVDGVSLLAETASSGAYGETYSPMLHYRWSPLHCWRDDRWAYLEGPNPELYDRVSDPGETRNIIRAHPEIADELSAKIAAVSCPPSSPASEALDEEARSKLQALGYVATTTVGYDPKKDPAQLMDVVNGLFHGITLLSEGRPRAALPALQSAYRGDADNAFTVFYLARCLREVGDEATAMTYYRRAVELNPRLSEAWAHLAVMRFDGGQKEMAFTILEDGLRVNPDAFALLMTAGDLSRDVGKLDEAKNRYEHAAEVAPTRVEPWAALVVLAEHREDTEEAGRLRARVRELSIDRPTNSLP